MADSDDRAHAGKVLREIRRRLELSQEALERRSGVSQTSLSRFEAGQDIYLSNAIQLADALGITLDELAGRAPLPAGAMVVPAPPTPKDAYPNRGRLRALPEYETVPAKVRALIEAVPSGGEDLTLFEWIEELRLLSMLHERGQLEGLLRARASHEARRSAHARTSGAEQAAAPLPGRRRRERFRSRREARALLDGAVAWLLSHELPAGSPSCFSAGPFDAEPDAQKEPARTAWCYGDPGVAAALLVAGRAVRERAWQREAMRIGLRAATRPEETTGVVDVGLCHGAAGLAHIFHRFYRASGDPAFAKASRHWFARTLAMRRARGGFAGFRSYTLDRRGDGLSWQTDPTLLTGAAGVTLALAAAVTGDEPEWDRLLLLS
jgi:transcriptional regulator with XRE-family HTH domain